MNASDRNEHDEILERFTAALAAGEEPPVEVREHVAACAACGAASADLRRVWEELGALDATAPTVELRTGFEAMLRTWKAMEAASAESGAGDRAAVAADLDTAGGAPSPPSNRPLHGGQPRPHGRPAARRSRFSQRRLDQIAFALAALLAGVLIGVFAGADRHRDEVSEMRSEMRDMRQVLTLSLLQQSSASGRLQGVSMGAQVAGHDPQVLAALLDTLGTDPNPNVRLAVVDALAPRAGDPLLQQRLGQVLRHESEPLVQIALADALLRADGEHARRIVAPLASDPDARPEVRKYVQQRLASRI